MACVLRRLYLVVGEENANSGGEICALQEKPWCHPMNKRKRRTVSDGEEGTEEKRKREERVSFLSLSTYM